MNNHIKETIENVNKILENKVNNNYNLEKFDTYQALMNKEEKVLDLINDIYKQKQESKQESKSILTAPLHVTIGKTLNIITNVYDELSSASTTNDVIDSLTKEERPMYIGIVFVILAIILMFVTL
jgi:hypothetical protein